MGVVQKAVRRPPEGGADVSGRPSPTHHKQIHIARCLHQGPGDGQTLLGFRPNVQSREFIADPVRHGVQMVEVFTSDGSDIVEHGHGKSD